MIGIVVVSHSRALGEAAVGLASEMVEAANRPKLAVAAGLDATTFGTDAAAVAAAIEQVDGPDGVLVLLDLGSAVLSAEMALEFVDPEIASRVVVSSAPLVEGLVAAIVTASTGASIDEVVAEAIKGLEGKQEHLGDGGAPRDEPAPVADAHDEQVVDVTVDNAHGLHARPAAKLVALVRSFDARVSLTDLDTGRGPIDAGSLSKVATLNARQGDRLRVGASGPDAAAALAAIADLAARAFDDEQVAAEVVPADTGAATGSGLDVAMGRAVVVGLDVDLSGYEQGDVGTERSRSTDALAISEEAIREQRDAASGAAAEIFDAHLALLDDPAIREAVDAAIAGGTSAAAAWSRELNNLAADLEGLDDAYQRERAQDVRSVQRRVLSALAGKPIEDAVDYPDGAIVVVPELDAATAAHLDARKVGGVATRHGGATGHGVIVTKSRGIPIITDVGDAAAGVKSGDVVAFDSAARSFAVNPSSADVTRYTDLIAARAKAIRTARERAHEPTVTRDGTQITVEANVTSVADATAAAALGAEGSGLVRTEILFGGSPTAPTVDDQAAQFIAIGAAFGGKPITIRTWDVGGDKPLAFMPQPKEANPFLGVRGLRLSRAAPEVFDDQLRAVCLAARETPVRVMFPMVTRRDEVDWALGRLKEIVGELGPPTPTLDVGIMIEVPAAALRAGQLARDLDFVSIGTNDLTQYTTAAERGNAAVADLADSFDPAVLGLIKTVCDTVPPGVTVAVCGDLASQLAAVPVLVGLGVTELSAVGPVVPQLKDVIRQITMDDARIALDAILAAESGAAVRVLL